MEDSVTVHMDAPVEEVWDLVSDVTRIGEFSPETFEAEWLGDATGPEEGARFRGHVKRNQKGPTYWSECEVTKCVPNEVFEFAVVAGSSAVNNWGYRLEAADGGTDVTEYFRLEPKLPMRIYWTLLGWARGKTNRDGMRTTLERMKRVVEAD
ncbi:MAG: SRPBCC family protein [Actinomycetota bacterium]